MIQKIKNLPLIAKIGIGVVIVPFLLVSFLVTDSIIYGKYSIIEWFLGNWH
jgi:hypothetical protein